MTSFTLHSNVLQLFVIVLITIISAISSFSHKINNHSEIFFWSSAYKNSINYSKSLSQYDHRVVIFGGSTVRSSYIPTLFEEKFSIPLVNYGIHAGIDARIITQLAFDNIKSGDVVIVALEPSFLSGGPINTNTGIDFFVNQKGLDFSRNPFFSINLIDLHNCLALDSRYQIYRFIKKITKMKPYRYTISQNLHDDGWMEVKEKRPIPQHFTQKVKCRRLSPYGREILTKIKKNCDLLECEVYYTLPTMYYQNTNNIYENATLLQDIIEIMPIVKDCMIGNNPDSSDFSDTKQHPLKQGAIKASNSLGYALVRKSFWTKEEINELILLGIENDVYVKE